MKHTLKRIGFQKIPVYRLKHHTFIHAAKQKFSLLLATLTIFSFVIGNMVGQHGWYSFWKTVLGKDSDAAIAYVGFVTPVALVPDYARWSAYGGSAERHSFGQVPKDILVALPLYDERSLRDRTGTSLAESVYSVGNLGDYKEGRDHGGSHVGVDIRLPVGTPIRSIGNGIVMKMSMQENGYGHHVMIKHPNVPDPARHGRTTTLYSIYAHLSTISVTEGQVVYKGQEIAASGNTGFASGPHLHFQIDNDDAPFHPYWPFTSAEATAANLNFTAAINAGLHQERGARYTVSPLVYVQSHEADTQTIAAETVSGVTTASTTVTSGTPASTASMRRTLSTVVQMRRQQRAERTASNKNAVVTSASNHVAIADTATASQGATRSGTSSDVDRLKIEHSGKLSRAWQRVKVLALDKQGNIVSAPSFGGRIYVVSEFGEADIRPSELSSIDFINGVATVHVLTRGTKTTFIATRGPFMTVSAPMVHER